LLPLVLESDLVVTHAFEGGHPDHDACALALHIACEQAADLKDHRPARVEFAIYALEKGRIVTNSFPGDEARTVLVLTEIERARKALALSAFASQRGVVEQFRLQEEQLRTAPDQDFFRLRDPRATLFSTPDPDRERRWREAAAASVGSTNT
jgi:LmbE family N-acetylglucosaminyl deacetylase